MRGVTRGVASLGIIDFLPSWLPRKHVVLIHGTGIITKARHLMDPAILIERTTCGLRIGYRGMTQVVECLAIPSYCC